MPQRYAFFGLVLSIPCVLFNKGVDRIHHKAKALLQKVEYDLSVLRRNSYNRNCNGVFIEKGMTVEVVNPTTSNPLNNPQGRDQIAAALTKYGVDMKKAQSLSSGYLDSVMSK